MAAQSDPLPKQSTALQEKQSTSLCAPVPKVEADLRDSKMLDQAMGELECSHHLTLCCSKCLPPPCTHRVSWGLKAHVFDFTRDIPTTLRVLKDHCQTR